MDGGVGEGTEGQVNDYECTEIAAVTVSPVMAVMVTSPVTKSSLVRSPVKELSPVRHFHR